METHIEYESKYLENKYVGTKNIDYFEKFQDIFYTTYWILMPLFLPLIHTILK